MTERPAAPAQRRRTRRRRPQRRTDYTPLLVMGGALVVVVLIILAVNALQNRPITADSRPSSRELGTPTAPLIIEEWSDFQ